LLDFNYSLRFQQKHKHRIFFFRNELNFLPYSNTNFMAVPTSDVDDLLI